MFWNKKTSPTRQNADGPLLDPESLTPLPLKETPGYYPGFHTLEQQSFWDAATRKLVLDRVQNIPEIRFFTDDEARTMQAVVARVLPQDDRTPATRVPILNGIDKRLFLNHIEGYRFEDMPSDQEAYRIAARAFDAMAQEAFGGRFASLHTMQQEELLQSVHDNKPLAAADAWKGVNVKRFWEMLVSDCCSVYYAHPYAWDEVGFGGPAYPRGYMRLEHGEPEPWEVGEQRYDWLAPEDTLSDREQKSGSAGSHSGQGGTH